ncbi:MAG: hypothetical protein QF831_04555 [Candidatus Thalassarchaeaceae archaeon]|nr:hypothetical protein [Candidatus Thalassarchaeaceae archaeon]
MISVEGNLHTPINAKGALVSNNMESLSGNRIVYFLSNHPLIMTLDKSQIGKILTISSIVVVVASLIIAGAIMIYATEYQSVDATPLEAEDEPSYSSREECAKKNNKGSCTSHKTIHMCMIEIKYSFILDDTNHTGESSADIAQEEGISNEAQCMEKGAQWRDDFLNKTSITVYYDPSNPSDNQYMEPTSPGENALTWGGGGLVVAVILFFVGRDMKAKHAQKEVLESENKSEMESEKTSEEETGKIEI